MTHRISVFKKYLKSLINDELCCVKLKKMKLVTKKITKKELAEMANEMFGNLVKVVVDIEKKIIAVDMPMHADGEKLLLGKGSRQEALWGINLHPSETGKDWIEFNSMINIRPHFDNLTRGINDSKTREKIIKIVSDLVG